MHRAQSDLAAFLRRRMIDLYLDDVLRDVALVVLERVARDGGANDDEACRLAMDTLDRWPAEAA
jgi:hypothetical protein